MTYQARVVEAELKEQLAAAGAVVIEGPKACGKTETARQLAASEVLLDIDANAREAATIAPEVVLDGPTPRLIDEWQVEPAIWNHVRRAVDSRRTPGQFILTGSAVPADDITRHTGAGRITRLRMRPMSLYETGHSSGESRIATLLIDGPEASRDSGLTIADLTERVTVGGWPGNRGLAVDQATRAVRAYLGEVQRTDISRVDNKRRNPDRVGRLLQALARNVATTVTLAALAKDAAGGDVLPKYETIGDDLDALERLMIVENQPAWAPHLRGRARLRSSPKRHFVDPSLAVAALHATPARLLRELNWFGFLFESLVIRDLRIYAQANDAAVRHYRDNTGLEVDAIVETAGGAWAAFEVKLGQKSVDEAASHLLRFASKVEGSACGRPTTLAVIVGTGYGYVRPDGVAVIPIGALGP